MEKAEPKEKKYLSNESFYLPVKLTCSGIILHTTIPDHPFQIVKGHVKLSMFAYHMIICRKIQENAISAVFLYTDNKLR